ncbi:type 2 periplasmic-binding domain-containing protein [Acetobacter suratthaniensis]|nr:hypothetical protein [Acetobacter suratthaniensis]
MEVSTDLRLTDVVDESFCAGVRLGEMVTKNIVSALIFIDIDFMVIDIPAYFAANLIPKNLEALEKHNY